MQSPIEITSQQLGIKIPTIEQDQPLPLETDFATLNSIRLSRAKIERVNTGATFQPYNQANDQRIEFPVQSTGIVKPNKFIDLSEG